MGCRVVSLPLAFSVALMVAALGTIAQSQTPPGTWTQKAPMPAVRGEVAAVGDKLFALGGGVAGKAVARNEEYDPASDRWRQRRAIISASPRMTAKSIPSAASPPRCTRGRATSSSNMIPRTIVGARSRP